MIYVHGKNEKRWVKLIQKWSSCYWILFSEMKHSSLVNRKVSISVLMYAMHICSRDDMVSAQYPYRTLINFHQRHTVASRQLLRWPFFSLYSLVFKAFISKHERVWLNMVKITVAFFLYTVKDYPVVVWTDADST